MASKKKISELIIAIKTLYPYYSKNSNDAENAVLIGTWDMLLKDYTDAEVDAALAQCLRTCKMPPTPADVIERIQSAHKAYQPTAAELWGVYLDALHDAADLVGCFGYTMRLADGRTQGQKARDDFQALFDKLPAQIREYLGTPSQLMRDAQLWANGEITQYDRNKFEKNLPIMTARLEYRGELTTAKDRESLPAADEAFFESIRGKQK